MRTRKKLLTISMFALLLVSILPQNITSTAATEKNIAKPSSIAIDGDLSDWANQPMYIVNDLNDDSLLDANHELKSIRISVNDTYLFIGLEATSTEGTLLYLDVDPGEGTGLTNIFLSPHWGNRPIYFVGGFGSEFYAGSWNYATPSLFDTTNYLGESGTEGFYAAVDEVQGVFEYAFPFTLLFGTNNVTDKSIGILALATGGDGTTALDTIPDDNALMAKSQNDLVMLQNYLKVDLDRYGNGTASLRETPIAKGIDIYKDNSIEAGNVDQIYESQSLRVLARARWEDNGTVINEHPNTTYGLTMNYEILDKDNTTVLSSGAVNMLHYAGQLPSGLDLYEAYVNESEYDAGNLIHVTITAMNNNSLKTEKWYNATVADQTKVILVKNVQLVNERGYVVDPAASQLFITAEIKWMSTTNKILYDDFSNTLNVTAQLSVKTDIDVDWTNITMEYISETSSGFNLYKAVIGPYSIPPYPRYTNITYLVTGIAENNTYSSAEFTSPWDEPRRLLKFSYVDAANDEFGTYPLNSVFSGSNLYDLLWFGAKQNDFHLEFAVQLNNLQIDTNGGNETANPIIAIYLNTKDGGRTETIKNENFVFKEEYAWDYAIFMDGVSQELYLSRDLSAPRLSTPDVDFYVTYNEGTGFINITIPNQVVGTLKSDWSYYVFVGASNNLTFRQIDENPTEWTFGGGSDLDLDPNVVDLLTPPIGEFTEQQAQDYLLHNYSPMTNEKAWIMPIGLATEDYVGPIKATLHAPAEGDEYFLTEGVDKVYVYFSLRVTAYLLLITKAELYMEGQLVNTTTIAVLDHDISMNYTLNTVGTYSFTIKVYDILGAEASVNVSIIVSTSKPIEFKETSTEQATNPGFTLAQFLIALAIVMIPVFRKKQKLTNVIK